ncbi:MAG TPA: LPS-assembly protein LptD [Patescibacteria group bacterium]|nr:LPS-assembly protein LptD [Patescibacteria group bacterium]
MGILKQARWIWTGLGAFFMLGTGVAGATPPPEPQNVLPSLTVHKEAITGDWIESLHRSVMEPADAAQETDEDEDDVEYAAAEEKQNGSGSSAVDAAPPKKKNKKKTKKQLPPAPIVVEGDKLLYNDATGEVEVRGNARVTQRNQKLQAELIQGNAQLGDFWVKDKMTFVDPDNKTNIKGEDVFYNVSMRTGTMEKANGIVDRQIVAGRKIDLFPEYFRVHDGTTTGCPAKVPDYHISADRIDIWPEDHLIAYNAKFWIKDTVIFSIAKYRKSLKKAEEGEPDFPQISYNNKDGLGIVQHLEYPLTDDISLFTDLGYFTKQKFKPSGGAVYRTMDYSVTVSEGNFRDADNNWLKKEPEYKFSWNSHPIGDLPLSYRFTAIYGKWTDDVKSSWHQDYVLYFDRDPIKLDPTLTLYLGVGLERLKESYNQSSQDIFRYDITLTKAWSPRFNSYVAYHFSRKNDALFVYSNDTPNRELAFGGAYAIDRLNVLGVAASYDTENRRLADVDYTWYRNLHCWQMSLTYRAKRSEWKWNVSVTRW